MFVVNGDAMFDAGGIWATPNILSFLEWDEIYKLVNRHVNGDFGEVDIEQVELNKRIIDKQTKRDSRIRSIYNIGGWRILVSTIPGEYTNVAFEVERFRWRNI